MQQFTLWYATEFGGKWVEFKTTMDEVSAGAKAVEMLKTGDAVSIRIELT